MTAPSPAQVAADLELDGVLSYIDTRTTLGHLVRYAIARGLLPAARPAEPDEDGLDFHRAENAEQRGQGICRTCCEPIWNEGGTIGRRPVAEGWSDRIERGGDSLVCFKAVGYRHEPVTGREAAIYDIAYARARSAAVVAEGAQ